MPTPWPALAPWPCYATDQHRAGRLYLPLDWLAEEGIAPETFLFNPTSDPRLQRLTRRLLRKAEAFYRRSETGFAALPLSCRPGIFAARHVYAGIGGAVARLN